MDNNKELKLGIEEQKAIINALLIGLESYGEIERICDAVLTADHCPNAYKLPDFVRPIHPTGSADTIGVFAAALRYMQQS